MPTISVKRDELFHALGKTYTDDEFQNLCFEFGLELDEVTTERQMLMKEQGQQAGAGTSEEVLYRVDIPANRYDLLCLEGLVNGLLVFQGKRSPPVYRLTKPCDQHALHVTAATAPLRPHAVAAVLRGVAFTPQSYASFIELQDKLHQNICRKRSLVAIGTHDLDAVRGPFVYDALPPADIRFRALNQPAEAGAAELMELYSSHAQLKQYVPLIRDSPVYPVIKDARGAVLSLPPIINGDLSKITLDTKNVFIECTATDLNKAEIVLDTLVCMFSVYCAAPYTVEPCKVYAPDGSYRVTPPLRARTEALDVARANRCVGIDESPEALAALLTRMCLPARVEEGGAVRVTVPPSRRDVLHACDLYEDIAIAYGYNNIPRRAPALAVSGAQAPREKLCEAVRHEMARAGYTEALTFTLCSKEDQTSKLNRGPGAEHLALVSNPATAEFTAVRATLLPGLLRALAAARGRPLPLQLFEVSDVVLRDDRAETGARNVRRLCGVRAARAGDFQRAHGVLDRVLQQLGARAALQPHDDPAFFPGRCARVVCGGRALGSLGVLHPRVLRHFDLHAPVAAFEIDLEPFV